MYYFIFYNLLEYWWLGKSYNYENYEWHLDALLYTTKVILTEFQHFKNIIYNFRWSFHIISGEWMCKRSCTIDFLVIVII